MWMARYSNRATRVLSACFPFLYLHGMYHRRTGTDDKRRRMDCQQEKSLFIKGIPMVGWKHGEPYSSHQTVTNLPNDQFIRLYASLCPFEATRGTRNNFFLSRYWAHLIRNTEVLLFPRSYPVLTKSMQGITVMGEDLRCEWLASLLLELYRLSGESAAFFSRARWFDLLMVLTAYARLSSKGIGRGYPNSWQKSYRITKRQKNIFYE